MKKNPDLFVAIIIEHKNNTFTNEVIGIFTNCISIDGIRDCVDNIGYKMCPDAVSVGIVGISSTKKRAEKAGKEALND